MTEGSELPSGWKWSTLSEVCEKIQDGTHFSPKTQLSEGKFRYITAKNVKPSGLDLSDVTYLTEENHREINERCDPRKGDVLLVKDGVNTGDAAINTLDEEISLLSSVCMLRAIPEVLRNQFLRYYLLSPTGATSLIGKMTGTAIRRVILKRVKETPIPLAPLKEQVRIVEQLEELLSDVDAGVAALVRARANLKKYRAAVLKAAVTGELTADWRAAHPNVEPATALLDRILTERRQKWEADQQAKFAASNKTPPKGWREKYPEATKPDTTDLFRLPESWGWATAEQLSDETRPITYGVIKLGADAPEGVPILRCSNVRHLSLELDEVKRTAPKIAAEYERTFLRGGEVLVNVRGTLGGVVRVPPTCAGYNIAREVAMIAPVDATASPTLAIFIGSAPLQAWLTRNTRGIAYTGINIESLKMLPIPLPPRAEQEAILAEVEQQLSVIAATDSYIEASLKRAARLRQSILKEAFAGRLVPQDPADEPASVLLDRIRQNRNAAGSAKATKPKRKRTRGQQEGSSFGNEGVADGGD